LGWGKPSAGLEHAPLGLVGWIVADGATCLGSRWLTLMPPPTSTPMPRASAEAKRCGPATPELLIGAGREARLIERIAGAGTTTLVLAADIEGAARWAQRLGKLGHVVRLDSGVADAERSQAWHALAGGQATLAVGTRSALLAPLPAGATVALIDEHEAAHKPPGAPRMHTRDIALERARRDGLRALLTSATPSVELWWQCDSGRMRLDAPPRVPRPAAGAVRLGRRARRARCAPAVRQRTDRPLRSRGDPWRQGRGSAKGRAERRRRHRHAGSASSVRSGLARPGRLRLTGSAPRPARFPRHRARVRRAVGGGRARWSRRP